MTSITPFETLLEARNGGILPLPAKLAELYGDLILPDPSEVPYVMGNFVSTLDGVVSLGVPGQAGGGEISGFNAHDRALMGILRAVADAVIVGAGTLRASPRHIWTPEHVHPSLAGAFSALRLELGKSQPPLNVIVTARGNVDPLSPVFTSGKVPVLIVTTSDGARRLQEKQMPQDQWIVAGDGNGVLTAQQILDAIQSVRRSDVLLVEAGPRLMGDFLAEGRLDELFLTLAPQVAGRVDSVERPGFVSHKLFAPEHPLWAELTGVKRADSHLFLRYTFR